MNNDLLRNVIYYCEVLRRRPLYAIVPAVLTVLVALAVILTLPRSYQAEALLLIETAPSSSTLLPETVASEQLQFIEQRVLAREKLLTLANEFDLFPNVREEMPITMVAELVRRHISIHTVAAEPSERYSGTSAMRIGFRSDTPAQASAVAARLVEMIIEENRRLRIQRAAEMTSFLEREAKNLAERLAQRDNEWRTYLAANADAMPARIQGLDGELNEKEREASAQAQAISSLVQEIRLSEVELRLGLQRSEPTARVRDQLAEMEAELAARSVVYSPEHPEIQSLNQRIASLKQRIAQGPAAADENRELPPELALVAERITIGEHRHEDLLAEQAETARRIAELRAILARAPTVQMQVDAFQRERDSIWRAADDVNGRLAAARSGQRLEAADSTSHVQIIERPETPRYPVSPNRRRLFLLALAASLGAGVAGLYLGEVMQRTVRGSFDLKEMLAGSTLVLVPHWQPEGERRRLADVVLDYMAGIRRRSPPARA